MFEVTNSMFWLMFSGNPLANQHCPPQQQQQQQQPQFPPQPFPRQRPSRPPPRPPPPRQTSLDIIQYHATPTTPHTPASLPNFSNAPSPTVGGTAGLYAPQQLQHSHSLSPSIYQQQHQFQQQQQQQPLSYQPHHNNHPANTVSSHSALPPLVDDYSDPDNGDYDDDEDDDDDYELFEPWECNMCTFRNHPQLNICECCDNVRIKPGTLTNLSRAISTNSANSSSSVAVATNAGSGGSGLTSVTNRSVTNINAVASGSVNSLNATTSAAAAAAATVSSSASANGNLEHDTNLAQQQLQHYALHT